MSKKILMVLTSHDKLGNTDDKTGLWIEEFAAPYYTFIDAGFNVTLASPLGGQPPIDPKSELADFQTQFTKRFDDDTATQSIFAATKQLSTIDAADYDAVFYPGGHGPLWDLTDNAQSITLIEQFLADNKPVASVCHATTVLLNIKNEQGEFAIKGKNITGFSNSEENAVQLSDIVPFLLEDEIKNRGANYSKGDDWASFVVQDGLFISGQNPASSELSAHKLIAHIS
jgi:putative intracellular protease/amidase